MPVYYALMTLFVFASVWLHLAAGDTFPIPWPDEAVFVQQASAFQQHCSLFSPQLNPTREIFWMPPGYMILLGMYFKIVGSGLFAARFFSLLLTASVFIMIAAFLKDEPARFFFLILGGLFFLSRHFIIMGNIARMEPLLIFGVVTAMWLFDRGNSLRAMILLVILGLVHPNAVYFMVAGVFYLFLQRYYLGEKSKSGRLDHVLLIVAGVLVSAYLIYAALHWADFISDMSYQFARKGRRYLVGPFATWDSRIGLCVLLLSLVLSLMQKNRRLIILTLFAGVAWMVNKIGQELWYGVFDALAFLFIIIVVIELLNPAKKQSYYAVLFLVALFISAGLGVIENPKGYPYSMKWVDMRMASGVSYFTSEDKRSVAELFVRNQKENQLLRVQFFPSADALFFKDMEEKTISSIYPAFPSSIFPKQSRDLLLIHVSALFTNGVGLVQPRLDTR